MIYTLNKTQSEGLKTVVDRFNAKEKYATIAGYAGTGKSFLVRAIIDALQLNPSEYRMATFTGKAALVLQKNGFHNAMTLHKLLYNSIAMPNGEFIHRPKARGDEDLRNLKLIIIDEISMVPDTILREASKHNIFIIALGDPFQLPPIGADNGLLKSPHVFLTEIMRQGEGNSIIEWSMKMRQKERFKWKNDDNVKIFESHELVSGMYHWADQIICATNRTRQSINSFMREDLGFTNVLPEEGDKVIAIRNNWDRVHSEGFAWVNGTIGTLSNVSYGPNNGEMGQKIYGDLTPDFHDIPFKRVPMDANPFKGLPQQEVRRNGPKTELIDFGYAITTHKSQGSQYKKVLIIEENWRSDQLWQLLYTAGTRAEEQLLIIKKEKNSVFL